MDTSWIPETRPLDRAGIKAVLEADQLIGGSMVDPDAFGQLPDGHWGLKCDNPAHCGVGAITFAAGVSNEQLRGLSVPEEFNNDILYLIYKKFGLVLNQLSDMMHVNDGAEDEDRQGKLFGFVDELPEETPFQASDVEEDEDWLDDEEWDDDDDFDDEVDIEQLDPPTATPND